MGTVGTRGSRICCMSLKYSKPDIFSELVAFGQEAEKQGHTISYVFSKHCRWLAAEFPKPLSVEYLGRSIDSKTMIWDTLKFYTIEYDRIKSLFESLRIDVLFFGNIHPANKLLATAARKAGCKEIWWWLHEPYRRRKKQYGWWRQYYYILAESFQPHFLKMVDRVILSSQEARIAFSQRYPRYTGRIIQTPLILLDYYEPFPLPSPEYVSFIGSAVPGKGVDLFFELVEYASSRKPLLKFQIITSSNIIQKLNKLSNAARSKLKAVSGDCISDLQLGRAVRNSLAVLTPYRQTMQSGVVPVAFMHGVPVICTDVGSMAEFVRPGETGLLIPDGASLDEWLRAIERIKAKREVLWKNCRAWYEKHHAPHNWLKVFTELFDGLE